MTATLNLSNGWTAKVWGRGDGTDGNEIDIYSPTGDGYLVYRQSVTASGRAVTGAEADAVLAALAEAREMVANTAKPVPAPVESDPVTDAAYDRWTRSTNSENGIY